MSNFSAQIKINASKEQVWAVLSDLGSIYKWNPGVAHSYSTSEGSGLLVYISSSPEFTTPASLRWRVWPSPTDTS